MCFISCNQSQIKALDPINDLAAYLNSKDGILYVMPQYEQKVLGMIKAESIGEGMYQVKNIPINDRFISINFTISLVALPYYFTFSSSRDYPPLLVVPDTNHICLRAYSNSECSKIHPAFVSDCLGTPKDKRHLGNFMIWNVDKWKSCQAGDDFCIELLSKVGEVEYHYDSLCMDTMIVTENLYQYQCLDWSQWP
jgi:hypothetical protein